MVLRLSTVTMADASDSIALNGIAYEPEAEAEAEPEHEAKLKQKIESLEKENLSLVNENEEVKSRVEKLTAEIESLRSDGCDKDSKIEGMASEIEVSQEGKKALESIAARALELETDVSRLQHDLISAMYEGEEASKEAAELRKAIEEKEVRIVEVEKERVIFEERVRVLEKDVAALEGKVEHERVERARLENELGGTVDEKKRELIACRKKVEELEKEVEELRALEENARVVLSKVVELEKDVKERHLGSGMALNGIKFDGGGGKMGARVQWPFVALGSTGAIVASAAVVYLWHARRS